MSFLPGIWKNTKEDEERKRNLPSLSSLQSSGRVLTLKTPQGGTVYAIGVYPCSTMSETEVTALISHVKPDIVYVDLHEEVLECLRDDLANRRTISDGHHVSTESRGFSLMKGKGFMVSMAVRNLLVDNEMLGLIGAELFGPFVAALRASSKLPHSPAILPFPYPMGYNNGVTFDRPGMLTYTMAGEASQFSKTVLVSIGNPNLWMFELPASIDMIGAVSTSVTIPDRGFFSRAEVTQIQNEFRRTVNRQLLKSNKDNCDIEGELLNILNNHREGLSPDTISALEARAATCQDQSTALAYYLQDAVDKLQIQKATETEEMDRVSPAVASGSKGDVAPATAVAVVSLGSLASLERYWAEARAPDEIYPPFSLARRAISDGAPVLLGGAVLYGYYRAFRRFPKTIFGISLVATPALAGTAYMLIHADRVRYGSEVRAALARPRVTSPLARVNK